MTLPTNRKPGGVSLPLASIIARAAATLPAETGATTRAAERRARGDVRMVLADVSGSMAEPANGRRKVDVLQDALAAIPPAIPIFAFASIVTEVPSGRPLPAPAGATALHLALAHAATLDPTHLLVISDGHPDDPARALAEADRLTARIDVIYCGPETDAPGLAFMRRLARQGGTVRSAGSGWWDRPERLASEVRTALFLPPARP